LNNKKGIRIVIALVLGLIISIAGVAYPGADVEARGKPQPASELVNFNLVGDELHFQLHLVNLNQAFSYQVTFERSGWGPVTDENLSPLGKVVKGYSQEVIRDISYGYPGTVQGHYNVQVELFNRKGISLGVTNATYECKFTVTFHETNLLSGVSIQLYSDPNRTIPKGSALTTNTSGNATIVLEDGYVYWYTATKTGYVDFMGDVSVHGHNLTVNFHMPLFYAVTFNVTNNVGDNLSDVYMDIYKCNGGSWDYIDSVTTNTTGQATIDLLEGDEYYYYATREGYNYLEDYFTVSGAPLTVSFTMYPYPDTYTVTFNETNGLSDVAITIYDWDWNLIDVVYTNTTGQATIDLLEDDYYYYADKSGYDEYEGDFTVSDSDITESFTMSSAPAYTVTFNETNGLSGVSIAVWDDIAWDWVGNIATNGTGQATIDLPNSDYTYYAMKSGYASFYDDFTVSDSPQTISFTMHVGYTVTFNETNGRGGVAINVYSDPDRTEGVCSFTTNSSGQGTAFLADGTYYYLAMKDSYADLLGDFTVSGAPLTEGFTMLPLIFAEDFTDVPEGQIPDGWGETAAYPNWGVSIYWSEAGGTTPEMVFSWEPEFDSTSRLITPEIDASAYSDLELTFEHFVDDWAGYGYNLKVQVSVDGGTNWADAWSVSPTGNIGPGTVTIDLSAYDGQTFKIAWVFDGHSYNIDYWHIDDIYVTGD
jgi:hypothetical protein